MTTIQEMLPLPFFYLFGGVTSRCSCSSVGCVTHNCGTSQVVVDRPLFVDKSTILSEARGSGTIDPRQPHALKAMHQPFRVQLPRFAYELNFASSVLWWVGVTSAGPGTRYLKPASDTTDNDITVSLRGYHMIRLAITVHTEKKALRIKSNSEDKSSKVPSSSVTLTTT